MTPGCIAVQEHGLREPCAIDGCLSLEPAALYECGGGYQRTARNTPWCFEGRHVPLLGVGCKHSIHIEILDGSVAPLYLSPPSGRCTNYKHSRTRSDDKHTGMTSAKNNSFNLSPERANEKTMSNILEIRCPRRVIGLSTQVLQRLVSVRRIPR